MLPKKCNLHSSALFSWFIYFVSADLPGMDTAHRLESTIRAKGTMTEVLAVLAELPNPLRESEDTDPPYNPLQIQVFVQTLLHLGSKSFSHAFAGISKFLKVCII